MKQPVVWSIAGSDTSAGAGLQADIKTIEAMGARACTMTTALTAQSLRQVKAVEAVSVTMLESQWQALSAHPPAAIKIGMLRGVEQIRWLADKLPQYPRVPVVCDPVLLASDGTALQDSAVRKELIARLLPRVTVLTPNVPEAQWLCGSQSSVVDMVAAIHDMGVPHVLLKGGHEPGAMVKDYLSSPDDGFWMAHTRLPGWIHGSGCVLSSALAAALARGYAIDDAAVLARRYLQQGWRLAAAAGEAQGDFCHAGWPLDAQDLPMISVNGQAQAYTFPA
ncbi:MAG: hydroxymethylpyrimidine/phosphomethylpyrimidine kinase, partial [Gammaproteobacteria bacterium]